MVYAVFGKWVKTKKFLFETDSRGSKALDIDEETTPEEVVKLLFVDYVVDESRHQIELSYMFSKKTLKKLGTRFPPVYITNTRQLQGFLSLRKTTEELILYVETTERKDAEVCQDDGAREKRLYTYSSEGERSDVESSCDDHSGLRCSKVEGEKDKVAGEDGVVEEDEEDDEFESRFDMFDDSDGSSSEDDNFSSYGEPPAVDEDSPTHSPTLPPERKSHDLSKSEKPAVLRSMSLLELAVGQRYETKSDLLRQLRLLTVKDQFDFNVAASNKDTLIVKCWVAGCQWRVRASTLGVSRAFHVRIYCSEHTCSVTERANRSRQAKPGILGQLYKDFIGDVGPSVEPNSVGIAINKQFGIRMNYWKSHRTLKCAREIGEGTLEIGFENLPSYLYRIRKANPGTILRLLLDESARFMYVFLAFGASIAGFRRHMRKVVIVDGTFLHAKYKGTLLTALAEDSNFQIFPIAFAVVDTENDDSWMWFFTQLKVLIDDQKGLAIISDRHHSIGKAIHNVYLMASRGICTYHLYKNILGWYKRKEVFGLVKKAARCFTSHEFDEIFREIEEINPELHGYLQRAGVELWARVRFPGDRYNMMTTNIAESMNRALSGARGLSIVGLFESIRVMMTRWFAERREDAVLQRTTLTRGVEKLLRGCVDAARKYTAQNIDPHHTEVTCGKSVYVVHLKNGTCTCGRIQKEKLLCSHAIAAAEFRNVSRISLCSRYYHSAEMVEAYAGSVMPVDPAHQVPEKVATQPCLPPVIRQPPGRPKKEG